MRSTLVRALAVLIVMMTGLSVRADVILGNYPPGASEPAGSISVDLDNTRFKALSFSMPAGTDYTVTSITLRLNTFTLGEAASIEIRNHNATNNPGATVIGSLTPVSGGGAGITDVTFLPVGFFDLVGGTSYWIVVKGDATSSFGWSGSDPAIAPTGIATYLGDSRFTSNTGASWSNSVIINSFRIDGVRSHILSNFPPANDTNTSADLDDLRHKALSFSMPAGADYTVTSITLRLNNFTLGEAGVVEIRNHNATANPGATLIGLLGATSGGGAGVTDVTFTPVGSVNLSAGTSYWILVRGEALSSFDWRGSSPAITPTGVATYLGNSRFSTNAGTSWADSTTINSFRMDGVIGWREMVEGAADAGDLPGTPQVVVGAGPLAAISGQNDANDADLFLIRICSPATFSAETITTLPFDTQLFLFRTNGVGIAMDDDSSIGTHSLLRASSAGGAVGALAPGNYLLGLTRYRRVPADAANSELWTVATGDEEAPPRHLNPFTQWVNSSGGGGAYRINLTGACYVPPGPVACNPADIVSVGQLPPPDGVLSADDFLGFLGAYFSSDPLADIVSVGGLPPPDGAVSADDFLGFLNFYFQGC